MRHAPLRLKSIPSVFVPFVIAASFGSGCVTSSPNRQTSSEYPDHWWQPVDPVGAPAWEILPQAADHAKGEVILSKRNELGIFSNFAATPFEYRGKRYASLEGFWQMMLYPEAKVDGKRDPRAKSKYSHTRAEVADMVAFEAKKAGEIAEATMLRSGIEWVSFEGRSFPYRSVAERGEHYRLIREAMVEKLRQNPKVRELLLATGTLVLRPDHHEEAGAPDEWRYFDIWMELRGQLQRGEGPR